MLADSQVDIPGGELGSPGISIFLSGPKIGAVVSTGTDTWTVVVTGVMPKNNTWNNIIICNSYFNSTITIILHDTIYCNINTPTSTCNISTIFTCVSSTTTSNYKTCSTIIC